MRDLPLVFAGAEFAFPYRITDAVLMTYPIENELPFQLAEKARAAALLGTRALIQTESFDALVALLVCSGAVPVERAQSMLTALSSTLKGHARSGHPDWAVEPAELRIQAERLATRAAEIGAR